MKKILSIFATVFAAAAGFAATPAAVWDGDFTAEQTGYTLNRCGNAISQDNSTITIDQSVGVKIDFDSAMTSGMTVMFRYASLALDADKTMATSFAQGSQENSTGVQLVSTTVDNETVGVPSGFYNTTTTYNTGATQNNVTSSKSSGVMAFRYTNGGGTELYYISNDAASVVYSCSALKTGADFTSARLKGCAIGGERDKSGATLFPAATGMKITGIAIFDSGLSEADMASYLWPSEVQTITVNDNTSVSAINASIESSAKKVILSVTDGVTISFDAAFSSAVSVVVESTGTITLSAASQPGASYFSNVDFSGVQGGLLRSWLTPGVVGFNFRSQNGTDVSGALATADNWIHDNNSASGTSTAMFADGLSTLTWSSANTWACSGSTIISGYLDDGANGGNGATVTLSNVPYEEYDVIVYCSSDTANADFLAKTVNGTTYTWDSSAGAVAVGNSTWGKAALSTPVYGVNALRIKNLSGPLTIYGLAKNGNSRGGIAAIEIMPPNTPDNIPTYKLTLSGTATTWSGGTWTLNSQTVDAPADGYVEIVASASTALTVDQAVSLTDLKVRGGENIVVNIANNGAGSLYAIRATVESGVFQQGSPAVLGTTPAIVVASGATFDENGMAVNAANAITIAGAGAGDWPWALTSSGGAGAAILGGLYLSANATIGGANELKIGQTQAGYYCYLQGFTLTKTGAGALTCTNMNTPGTGTINVEGGAMAVNQWNNLNNAGGDTTVILRTDTSLANGTDRVVPMGTLKLLGGTLTTPRAFKVNTLLVGGGETANLAFADGASASLTGNLIVTDTLTLDGSMTFSKDENAAEDVMVTVSGTLSSSGTISVGNGVTLYIGTNRTEATLAFADSGALAVKLQSTDENVSLSASSKPGSVILYDVDGTEISNPGVVYSDGTLKITRAIPTLRANGVTSFDAASSWVGNIKPSDNGRAIIELGGDANITVSGAYSLSSLFVTGSGVATFSGDGSIVADTISVNKGTTLVRGANISATSSIVIDSGAVLRLVDGVTESAVISGAGAVETYGDVTMSAVNTFTGGITAKSGTLSTTTASGFGKDNTGLAYSALSQITVEDGACVDLNSTKDHCYALTIAGKGVLQDDGTYSGAVKNTGVAMGSGARQTASLTLTADAMVDVSSGWGLVQSSHAAAYLARNGHELTFRGTGTVPMVNVNASNSSGTIVFDGATFQLSNAASNFTGVNIIVNGGSSLDFSVAPSAIGSLTFKPTETNGVTATALNLPDGFKPVLSTELINDDIFVGDAHTLFTAPSSMTLSEDNITISASSALEKYVIIKGNTVKLGGNFLHYDFNKGAGADTGKADDSMAQITFGAGEHDNVDLVFGRNGKAVKVQTNYTPWWNGYSVDSSPFASGAITVTTVARFDETDNLLMWCLGGAFASASNVVSLVAVDDTTIAVIAKKDGNWGEIVRKSGIDNLKRSYHFIAVVADENGTALYVDRLDPATTKSVIAFDTGTHGQLGSVHGGAPSDYKKATTGYRLDDWAVYPFAMTETHVAEVRERLFPKLRTLFLIR